MTSGRGAAWLARLLGVQEVPGSNPGGPTKEVKDVQTGDACLAWSGARLASNLGRPEQCMDNGTNERIVKTPGVCGGRARIVGHRVRVQDIVSFYEHQGLTPDEIVSHIPTITLADVHIALAYYFDHVQEIQEELRADRAYAEEFRQNNPSLLDVKLRQEPLKEAS